MKIPIESKENFFIIQDYNINFLFSCTSSCIFDNNFVCGQRWYKDISAIVYIISANNKDSKLNLFAQEGNGIYISQPFN